MKVLMINTVPTGKNGITNVIFNYISAIHPADCVFDYISLNEPEGMYTMAINKQGGKVYHIKRSPKKILAYVKNLSSVIKQNAYDLVHVHGNSHTVVIELIAARIAGCNVRVVHAHNTSCKYILLHKLLTPFFNSLCTHRLACGEAAGCFMFGDKPFSVMNNGIDTDRFAFNATNRAFVRNSLGWINNPIIGQVGYFTAVKNQSFILDVFECLLKHKPEYRLLLIGDGPLKNDVMRKAESKQLLDYICFTGDVNNVSNYLSAIDTIVMPSLFEGLPLTLIEQQANGLQCVVADSITREVDITGNLCFLKLTDSANKWAEVIESINDGLNREERSSQAIVCIRKAGYDIKAEAKKLIVFYSISIHSIL